MHDVWMGNQTNINQPHGGFNEASIGESNLEEWESPGE
jgi:hypothetical protein